MGQLYIVVEDVAAGGTQLTATTLLSLRVTMVASSPAMSVTEVGVGVGVGVGVEVVARDGATPPSLAALSAVVLLLLMVLMLVLLPVV
jgi:hypothetical protein